MKKEKIREIVKAAIPAIMVLSRTWTVSASVGGDVKPTAADVAAFRNQETQQEQPAQTAFIDGEDSEGKEILVRKNGCQAECMASCEGKCEWGCSTTCSGSCQGGCKEKCTGKCKDDCAGGCWETCKGGCKVVCRDNCYGGCMGTCTAANWDER